MNDRFPDEPLLALDPFKLSDKSACRILLWGWSCRRSYENTSQGRAFKPANGSLHLSIECLACYAWGPSVLDRFADGSLYPPGSLIEEGDLLLWLEISERRDDIEFAPKSWACPI
jgi:hypothetical protein